MTSPFSTDEWERIGTNEPDLRHELGAASSSPIPAGYVIPATPTAPATSSFALSQPPPDPQPFNPSYQLQTGITDWINIRALGARGDGVTDDLPIFQAANLIAQIAPKRMIYIPAGTYFLSGPMVLATGVQYLNMGTITGSTLTGGTANTFSTGTASLPFTVIAPSGDTTGATDITNINAGFTAVGNTGIVWLLPNSTYYIGSAGISVPPYASLWGGSAQTTVINCVGSGTGTYILQFNSANPTTYTRLSGSMRDFIVDGTGAGAGAIGVQYQDVNTVDIRIAVRNFTGAGSVGMQIANNTHSTNNMTGFARIENCTTCLQFNVLGAQTAIEHIYIIWNLVVNAGQNAIVLANSVGVQGSNIIADVGVLSTSAGPVFTFGASTTFTETNFLIKAELTNPAVSASTVSFSGAGSGFVRTTGILFFSPNLLASNVVAQNGQVKHFGTIINESSLIGAAIPPVGLGTYDLSTITTPAFPGASGTAVTNNTGIPVLVTVAGGTLSGSFGQVNGVTVGDVNTRVFYIPRTQTITLNWSAAPSGWTWQPVG